MAYEPQPGSKRALVQEMINEGTHTKADIAAALETTVANVSSQMTYLRYGGLNIITDPETKVLRFCTDEEFAEYEAEKEQNKKPKANALTPCEQLSKTTATVTRQEKAIAAQIKKLADIDADLADVPDDEELLMAQKEAQGNIMVLEVKLWRNNNRVAELRELCVDQEPAVDADDLTDGANENTDDFANDESDESDDLL